MTVKRRVSRIGVFTHVRTLEPIMIADLDTLLTARYVELTDSIIPSRGLARSGPGKPPGVTDAELACLAVAQVLLCLDDGHRAPVERPRSDLVLAGPPGVLPLAGEAVQEQPGQGVDGFLVAERQADWFPAGCDPYLAETLEQGVEGGCQYCGIAGQGVACVA